MGIRPPAHGRRRADPAGVAGAPASHRRALDARELGRNGLPGRARGRADPHSPPGSSRCDAYHAMSRTARNAGAHRRGGAERARALLRHQFDPPSCAPVARVRDSARPNQPRSPRGHTITRPRSSVDRAADSESAGGGSTPPGAIVVYNTPASRRGGSVTCWGLRRGHIVRVAGALHPGHYASSSPPHDSPSSLARRLP